MLQPYFHDPAGMTIYQGDCYDLVPAIAREYRVDLVLTDPPYGQAYQPGGGGAGASEKTFTNADRVIGDDAPFDPAPLLRLDCPAILWGAQWYSDRLPVKSSWLVWYKKDGMPSNSFGDAELAWSNLGGPARVYSHVWNGMIRASERDQARRHPTAKPVALMRWCLQVARLPPGALVLDPFMGSGPVAQACKELGLRYVGVELVESYCAAAADRLSQEVMPLFDPPS